MDRNIEIRGQWVMDYFRHRWAYERSADCIVEFLSAVDGLKKEEAELIVTGYKKLVSKSRGYAIEDDNALTIDELPLRWNE